MALATASAVVFDACPADAQPATDHAAEQGGLTALTARDLLALSDLGPVYPSPGEPILRVSPNGKKVAVQVRRADAATNEYRFSVLVADVAARTPPTQIDSGGEFIFQTVTGVGGATVRTGYVAGAQLQWSSDGKWVYFLKRTHGHTQIWRATVDGSVSEQLTNEIDDINEFFITSNGQDAIYSHSPKTDAVAIEGLEGYRFDDRFVPIFANGPDAMPSKRVVQRLHIRTKSNAPLSEGDLKQFDDFERALAAEPRARSADGRIAFVSPSEPNNRFPPGTIVAQDRRGGDQSCRSERCKGVTAIWWIGNSTVRFIRRDGWGDSETVIYEWKLGSVEPRRVYGTTDLLLDCTPIGRKLLCARERSTTPRHLALLDPDSSKVQVIFDPNPNFQRLSLGRVERMHWLNRFGIETFGDLIYPTNYVRGRPYPLIVVQYTTRGFLRGGVGDEFPIQAFSNRGYAVLSVQRPAPPSLQTSSVKDADGAQILADRRSVLSSVQVGVEKLIQRGIADRHRIGITGLSDGSSTVQFALVNTNMFRAASVSGCCWEPFQDALVGTSAASAFHQFGWPTLLDYRSEFWTHISLVENARSVSTPLLMQQSDDEFRGAIASYIALKQANQSAALFVFPAEHHVKWQPAHRLAAYERNLRWFDYWLKGIGDPAEWQDARVQ
ncbi:Atxe2 family lasso peptide isopeptidase [Sphingobium yanoikuyae]|uniref:Atxe2 family lasso peptide isopeptidase n=1 Tax=Sphingobium yanoikuyae TaxID=13690 RepID=UPI0022DD61A9|nr:Atxe2 family lasso peptide isopeptidase [Sphingobium yanoikuyae]WBQ17674.1 Atxe2 family lasso peptide isopeptidase [Sphingobium yanoikuyae]